MNTKSELIKDFVSHVPAECRIIVRASLADELASKSELIDDLQEYILLLKQRSASQEFLDYDKAMLVADQCEVLLGDKFGVEGTERHAIIQAAVRYFILEDDAESDSESLIGFDDDEAVVAAAMEVLEAQNNN